MGLLDTEWSKTKAILLEGYDLSSNFDGSSNNVKVVQFDKVLEIIRYSRNDDDAGTI